MKQSFLITVAFYGFASLWAQESFTHQETGLTFTLPAGWSYSQEGDHFEAVSADESVYILFVAGSYDDAEAAIDGAVDALSENIYDVRITTDATQETINGLLQIYLEGDGRSDGAVIDWDLTLVISPNSSLAVIAIGDIDSNQATLNSIYTSIR